MTTERSRAKRMRGRPVSKPSPSVFDEKHENVKRDPLTSRAGQEYLAGGSISIGVDEG